MARSFAQRPSPSGALRQNPEIASYALNQDAVTHAKQLIDARRYVLRSRWQDVQPRAREQNAFLKAHSVADYALWHLGRTEGAVDETGARVVKPSLRLRPATAQPENGSTTPTGSGHGAG